jgi:hypothetical protein
MKKNRSSLSWSKWARPSIRGTPRLNSYTWAFIRLNSEKFSSML